MASHEVLNAMESLAYERDRQEFSFGDTLDIKTGLILAALTFLAIQSGESIHSGLPFYAKLVHYISIGALIVGGVLATLELRPRDYDTEPTPDKYQNWIAEKKAYGELYPDDDPVTVERLTALRVGYAIENVQTNVAINRRKSRLMFYAFWCAVIAFAANIGMLISRLF
jgi:hypothetical protein